MPFRGLRAPKRRLAPLLSLAERRELSIAMLTDVLATVGASGFARLLVVSRDPAALELASKLGVETFVEGAPFGYRSAAHQVAEAAAAAGAAGLLIVPADVPLVEPAELRQLGLASEQVAVTLVGSTGGGTSAVLTRPPNTLEYRFGRHSFRQHLRLARRERLEAAVLYLAGLDFDVDEPADLERLVRLASEADTATGRCLRQLRIVPGQVALG